MPVERVEGPLPTAGEQDSWDLTLGRLDVVGDVAAFAAVLSVVLFVAAAVTPMEVTSVPASWWLAGGALAALTAPVAGRANLRRAMAIQRLALDQRSGPVPLERDEARAWLAANPLAPALDRARASLVAGDHAAAAAIVAGVVPRDDLDRVRHAGLLASLNRGERIAPFVERLTELARALPAGEPRRRYLLFAAMLRAEADVLAGIDPIPAFDASIRVAGPIPVRWRGLVAEVLGLWVFPLLTLGFALASLATNGFGLGFGSGDLR